VLQFQVRWSVGIFADRIEVTIRHHALESGCTVNSAGWLSPETSGWKSRQMVAAKRFEGFVLPLLGARRLPQLCPPIIGWGGMAIRISVLPNARAQSAVDSIQALFSTRFALARLGAVGVDAICKIVPYRCYPPLLAFRWA
jgi:hypothetical protein